MRTIKVASDTPARASGALLAVGDDLRAHIARPLEPEDLIRLGAVSRDLKRTARRPDLWRPHVAKLPPPRPPVSTPDPRAAWLRAQAPHRLDASAARGLARPGTKVLAVAVGEQTLVSSWADGRVRVHSAADGQPCDDLVGHAHAVTLLAADEGVVVGGAANVPAHIWCGATGELRNVLDDGAAGIVALLVRRGTVITAATDGAARIWSAAEGRLLHTLSVDDFPVCPLAASDRWVATANDEAEVRLWSLADGTLRHQLETERSVTHVAVSDEVVVAASIGGHRQGPALTFWSAPTGAQLRAGPALLGAGDFVTSLAADGGTVVVGTARGWLDVWTDPWEKPWAFRPLLVSLDVAAISVRGDTLVACYGNGAVRVASLARRETRQILPEDAARPGAGHGDAPSWAWRDDVLTVAQGDSVAVWRFDQPRPPTAPKAFVRATLDAVWGRIDYVLWALFVHDV